MHTIEAEVIKTLVFLLRVPAYYINNRATDESVIRYNPSGVQKKYQVQFFDAYRVQVLFYKL